MSDNENKDTHDSSDDIFNSLDDLNNSGIFFIIK